MTEAAIVRKDDCPFCGNTPLTRAGASVNGSFSQVECMRCGACGPRCTNVDEAHDRWGVVCGLTFERKFKYAVGFLSWARRHGYVLIDTADIKPEQIMSTKDHAMLCARFLNDLSA